MVSCYFILLVFIVPTLVKSCYDKRHTEVMSSLMKSLNAKHCLLVRTQLDCIAEEVKYLSDKNIYAAHLDFKRFIKYLKGKQIVYQKLVIFLKVDDDSIMKSVLKDLKTEISYLDLCPKFKWIMFVPETTTRLTSNDIHIPFNCQFILVQESNNNYKISEIYQIKKESDVLYTNLGRWEKENGVGSLSSNFHNRRINFRKENLIMEVRDQERYYSDLMEYIQLKFWQDLQNIFNFTTTFVQKNASDVIGDKADSKIGIATFHFFNDRSHHMVAPIMITRWHLYIQGSEDIVKNWGAYLKPFDYETWYGLILSLIVSSAITTLIGWAEIVALKRQSGTLYEQAMMPLAAFCNQPCNEKCTIISARIARLASYITPNCMVPAYSAAIISFLAVFTPHMPFYDFNSFVKDGTYQLAPLKKYFSVQYLHLSEGSAERIINENYVLPYEDLPETHEAAIEMLCTHKKISVLNFNYRIFHYPSPCPIIKVSGSLLRLATGIQMSNYGVHYVKIFRNALTNFHTAGIFNRWRSIYYGKRMKEDHINEPIDAENIVPLILILLVGVAFSCILLIVEIKYDYFKHYQRSKNTFVIPKIKINVIRSGSDAFVAYVESANYFNARKSSVIEYFP